MKKNTYYFPLSSVCLSHYIASALISPAKYYLNRPEDVQSYFGNHLLLSKNKWTSKTDCSIEIILTDEEVDVLIDISNNFYILQKPLPISRIIKVWFLNIEQKSTTLFNINAGAGYVLDDIASVEIIECSFIDSPHWEYSKEEIEYDEKIKKFDIILGGLAFMKVADTSYYNYSDNYFYTLGYFNSVVRSESLNNWPSLATDKYHGLFTKKESPWKNWLSYIYKEFEMSDIEYLADIAGFKIAKKFGMLQLDSISPSSHIYEIATLAIYGENKSKSTDDLVHDINKGVIQYDKKEDVSIVYGLKTGYNKLRNEYKSNDYNSVVKYKMESKLDYYTIESVYNFVFNGGKESHSFPYIDNICPTKRVKNNAIGSRVYYIIDECIVSKKKSLLEECYSELSKLLYPELQNIFQKVLPPFIKIDRKEAEKYWEQNIKDIINDGIKNIVKLVEISIQAKNKEENDKSNKIYEEKINSLLAEVNIIKQEHDVLTNEKRPTRRIYSAENGQNEQPTSTLYVGEEDEISYQELSDHSKEELLELAGKLHLKGYKRLTKEKLIIFIEQAKNKLI